MDIFKTITGPTDQLKQLEAEETLLVKGAVIKARVIQADAEGQAILRSGSRLIQAAMSEYVEPGRAVKAVVVQTSPQVVLNLLDEEPPGALHPPVRPAGAAPPALRELPRAGAEIMARILEAPVKGQVKIRILSLMNQVKSQNAPAPGSWPSLREGQELSARLINPKAGLSMAPGQEVRFLASGNSSKIMLQPVPAPSERPALMPLLAAFLSAPDKLAAEAHQILTALADNTGLPANIEEKTRALSTLIKDLSPGAEKPDLEFVPRLLARLGLAGEKDEIREGVARLLSEIASRPGFEQPKEAAALKTLAESSVRLFEAAGQIQTLGQETMNSDQLMYLAFPIFWPGENGRGEIAFKKSEDNRSARDRTFRVTMLLCLTRIGRVKIDLAMENKKIDAPLSGPKTKPSAKKSAKTWTAWTSPSKQGA